MGGWGDGGEEVFGVVFVGLCVSGQEMKMFCSYASKGSVCMHGFRY